MGARLAYCTFDNFDVTDQNREAYAACRRLAEEGRPGVLLMGKNGVGKTHLLVATLKAFDAHRGGHRAERDETAAGELRRVPPLRQILQNAERTGGEAPPGEVAPTLDADEIDRTVLVEYWPLLDLVCELRLEITRGVQEVSRRCRDCDLLVLDDFGAERVTDFVLEELERIVDWRYRAMKPTAIATNLKTSQIVAKYGQRALSRWAASCELVTLLGEDRRASMVPT